MKTEETKIEETTTVNSTDEKKAAAAEKKAARAARIAAKKAEAAAKKAASKIAHQSATGKYKSGRALIIEMIQAGKYTMADIHKKWGKEFPDAPANGYKGYVSWAFIPKMVKRSGGQLVTIDLKTGIISLLGKKKNQHTLAEYRKAAAKKTDNKKTDNKPAVTIRRRNKKTDNKSAENPAA